MAEHDDQVGMFLDKLDELGIADNTIVIYSTDNGAETVTWPDGGITPFKGEKGTTWEGGFRVPLVARWPGVIEPGTKNNGHHFPRGLAADPDGGRRRAGYRRKTQKRPQPPTEKIGRYTSTAYNFLPRFKGEAEEGPRDQIFYFGQGRRIECRSLERLEGPFRGSRRRDQRRGPFRDRLARHYQPEGRPIRTCLGGIGDVPSMDGRQYVAVRPPFRRRSKNSFRRWRIIPSRREWH